MIEITLLFQFIFIALALGVFALACAVGLVAVIVVLAGRILALIALTPRRAIANARVARVYAPISPNQGDSQPSPSQLFNDPAR
jgi:hypothetical protein